MFLRRNLDVTSTGCLDHEKVSCVKSYRKAEEGCR